MKKIFFALVLLLIAVSVQAQNLTVDSVTYTPAPAIPGQYVDLFVLLKNDSSETSKQVELELDLKGGTSRDSDWPFSLASGANKVKTFAEIKPYKTVLAEYKIRVDPDALDGDYTLTAKYNEVGADAKKTSSFTIKVLNRKPDLEIVDSSELQAAPGQVLNLNLTLRNVGNSKAKDILVGVEEDRTVTSTGVVVEREFSAIGASFGFLTELSPGEEGIASLSLAVNPEAEQKNYTIPIAIKYKDANGTSYSETTYIGLKINQEPELDAVVSEVEPLAFPGGKSEITVDLFNVGVGTAKYVVVEASTEAGELEQEKVFIGTLEADDFDSFKINMAVNANADPKKTHLLNLKLLYKNQYGEQREIEKQLMLKVHSAAEVQAAIGAANPALVVVGLISLLLQLVGLVVVAKWVYKKFVKRGQ